MNILDVCLHWNQWLQAMGEWLRGPMGFFSYLGNEEFFLLIAPALYWCVDAALGLRVGLFLMLSAGANHVLKLTFHTPRPYWYSRAVQAYTAEGSFGVPSGHAQNAAVVWGSMAAWYNRRWSWISGFVVIFLIGISRIYMGVHFLMDVLAGWLAGAVLLWILLKASHRIERWIGTHSAGQGVLAALAGALAIILVGVLAHLALGNYNLPQEWVENARLALPDAPVIDPLALSGLFTNSGAFFGLAAGAILLRIRGGYAAGGEMWKRVLRYFVGVAGILVLYQGLGAVFPRGESLIPYILRFIRYALIGGWVTGLAPLVFYFLRLAERPLPQTSTESSAGA